MKKAKAIVGDGNFEEILADMKSRILEGKSLRNNFAYLVFLIEETIKKRA